MELQRLLEYFSGSGSRVTAGVGRGSLRFSKAPVVPPSGQCRSLRRLAIEAVGFPFCARRKQALVLHLRLLLPLSFISEQ